VTLVTLLLVLGEGKDDVISDLRLLA
jgi:hypothetical protein